MEGASAMTATRTTVDVAASARASTRRRPSDNRAKDLRVVEHCLELVTFPLADLAPVEEAVTEVAESPVVAIQPRERHEGVCRAMNFTIALIALIALSPIFLLIALAVKLTSRGPIFYSQVRVGVDRRAGRSATDERRVYDLGGRPFTMYKFRSMHVNAEPDGRAVWALRSDPRVTLVGRVLRRLSVDELPQLVNVLKGQMSLVGPRPLAVDPESFAPAERGRHAIAPGITGYWQVNGGNALTYQEMIKLDLAYIHGWTLWLDVLLLARTVPALVRRRGPW